MELNKEDRSEPISCPYCKKKYRREAFLTSHIKTYHTPVKSGSVSENNHYLHPCRLCPRGYNDVNAFKRHQWRCHGGKAGKITKCALCTFSAYKKEVVAHYESVHEVNIVTEEKVFHSWEEFKSWKDDIEQKTKAKYVTTRKELKERAYYTCHRSGNFVSQGQGQRTLKNIGSSKINALCPANIKLRFSNGAYHVTFVHTHVGHDNDVKHLRLSKPERDMIAQKIADKIPFDEILNELKTTPNDQNSEKKHFLTRKDLYNIEKCYNLESDTKHGDEENIEELIKEMISNEKSCLLYFKPQDCISSDYPQLKKNDFVLIIMTEAQMEYLKRYGGDIVCVDPIQGSTPCVLNLIALIVIDDRGVPFPCAFLISNEVTQDVLEIFYSLIREHIGQLIPNAFMSDLSNLYYDSWVQIMGEPKDHLYCTWHVDQKWRKNLHKIKGKVKQAETYKVLRTLLSELDIDFFNYSIEDAIVNWLKDPDMVNFASYFQENYINCVVNWACCHRMHCGPNNNNLLLEEMHKTLKCIYFHGKNYRRLDKAVRALMKFVKTRSTNQQYIMLNNDSELVQYTIEDYNDENVVIEEIREDDSLFILSLQEEKNNLISELTDMINSSTDEQFQYYKETIKMMKTGGLAIKNEMNVDRKLGKKYDYNNDNVADSPHSFKKTRIDSNPDLQSSAEYEIKSEQQFKLDLVVEELSIPS